MQIRRHRCLRRVQRFVSAEGPIGKKAARPGEKARTGGFEGTDQNSSSGQTSGISGLRMSQPVSVTTRPFSQRTPNVGQEMKVSAW
jgi:hypothetical protein